MPAHAAGSKNRAAAVTANAPGAPRAGKCSASGPTEGERFAASHCAVSLFGDQHSVAIGFDEDPVHPPGAKRFQLSSNAEDTGDGGQRTMITVMFCPGWGAATASAAAVKSIDLNTNHARSPLGGVQWVAESPKDLKVERVT